MAVIHQTTMVPSKRELLTAWLPKQDWYMRRPEGPSLARAGGFRLDDPAGEVGIEFDVARDDAANPVVAYLVPMTYRGGPLPSAETHLIGTAEHGVLGPRWIYDGTKDPVLLGQLAELIQGRVQAQAQGKSNTPDTTVRATPVTAAPGQQLSISFSRRLSPVQADAMPSTGEVTALWTAPDGSLVRSLFATGQPRAD
ncbi:MAG: 1,4-alpha-glucan branching protein [Actinobacteria bacterium]|nr:1,4-alpha-glucan branching protein [Actinomycetota bacterium]MBO0834768.1 1,4-alpha-glucan branching protein [Actinomycetota bacterium]